MQKWMHHLKRYPDNMISPFRWKSESPKATLGRLEMTNQTGVQRGGKWSPATTSLGPVVFFPLIRRIRIINCNHNIY
jgi:hypothetical protein